MEDITSLIGAISEFVGVLIWPLVVIFLAVTFGKPLRDLIGRIREASARVGPTGLEVSAKILEL